MLLFKNIAKKYEGNLDYTLENINLEIENGEFVALLGPSGCGKTTLLRMIAGLNSITKGDLIFNNKKINNLEPKDRDIAMVFQSYALYPHMTVYKNIAYSLMIRKVDKRKIDERVKSVSKMLKIDHVLYKKPGEISGGQRQRVALGRAIVRKPKIFLMDEPLSNLDAKLRESMRTELVKIHKMLETTTVYVTHDQLEAMTMADKIVLFNNQKIQQVGKPIDLYENPANLFVAKFIGTPSINVLSAKWNDETKELLIGKNKFNITSKKIASALKGKEDISIALRPNLISLTTEKTNVLPAAFFTKEELGDKTYFKVNTNSSEVLTFVGHHNKAPNYGQPVKLKLDLDNAFYFDSQTEERII